MQILHTHPRCLTCWPSDRLELHIRWNQYSRSTMHLLSFAYRMMALDVSHYWPDAET